MDKQYTKITSSGVSAPLKVRRGHFATNHAHTNYFLDVTTLKTRASEAHDIASALSSMYLYGTVIDTIVCVEGTEVIGAYLAEELTESGFLNTNAHKTIYVVTPEYNSNSQVIFRDNLRHAVEGKHVLILGGTICTGKTVNRIMEAILYYGGTLAGISAIFSSLSQIHGMPVLSVFGRKDLPDYSFAEYHECPLCKAGQRLDGLVNAFGVSLL
ncbi:orotate phosphoribosyltransferase [Oribacterium sp. oral taxon 102]|uniref:orotate phosphoribosyltransferase n=1 Tax=Oribacterium sp. oral taxon 102 TaxID=671214 RepID=UPI0015C1B71C|nr:orotate phosphoribosyltransferase [Oribacterium sp. oral taxon 102]NWO21710.1 orotate phosphoribosyltransferase [Oribacterium sp. oral taxon 102]